jgi:S1-C subfamily serine protease
MKEQRAIWAKVGAWVMCVAVATVLSAWGQGDMPEGEEVGGGLPSDMPTEIEGSEVVVAPPPEIVVGEGVGTPDAFVRVNVTAQGYQERLPWQKSNPVTRRGIGAIIEGGAVLVTARLVTDLIYAEFEHPRTGQKVGAEIEGVDYEANLALLRPVVGSEDFLEAFDQLEIAGDAELGDSLTVYQVGETGRGTETRTTLLRFTVSRYFLRSSFFLAYQAFGTIQQQTGSFTLPVLRDGRLAGLVVTYSSDDQVSTILPAPIIRHFLEDLREGEYGGFPNLGVSFQSTLDEQFRRYLKLGDREGGVFVTRVQRGSTAELAGVKTGDVLLQVGDHPLDGRGFYEDPDFGPLPMSHLVRGRAHVGEALRLVLWRDGEEMELEAELRKPEAEGELIRPFRFGEPVPYVLHGGLLFQELSVPYLESFGGDWEGRAPARLVQAWREPDAYEEEGRDSIVFLSGVVPTESTQGYEPLGGQIVERVNGKDVPNLRALAEALDEGTEDGIHRIELAGFPGVLFLDEERAAVDNEVVLRGAYRVPELRWLGE